MDTFQVLVTTTGSSFTSPRRVFRQNGGQKSSLLAERTGTGGPDVSAGQGITTFFAWPLSHPPCCLLLSGVGDSCARLSHTRTASACDVFLSANPSLPVSPHDHRFECRWRYLWNPGAHAPPGGLKKKGLFSSVKNHPGGGPRHHPKTRRSRRLRFAGRSFEASRLFYVGFLLPDRIPERHES